MRLQSVMQSIKASHQKRITSSGSGDLVSRLLLPAAWAFGFGTAVNNLKYDVIVRPQKLSQPVISIGNITVGGTGKTPFTIYLARKIMARGKKSAILMRGYGADEILELERNVPQAAVIVDRDRFRGAQKFTHSGGAADVFLMDDGFQHRGLARDVNIVLINSLNPFGNRWLLPAGSLREPLTALQRADVIALTHADEVTQEVLSALEKEVGSLAPHVPIITCGHVPDVMINTRTQAVQHVTALQGQPVIGFSGIGFNAGFLHTLTRLGAHVVKYREFLDHAHYMEEFIPELERLRNDHPDAVCVTTEKDYLRDRELFEKVDTIFMVRINIKVIQGEAQLDAILDRVLSD